MQAVSNRIGHSFAILNLQILYTVSFLSRFNASAICLGGLISSNEMIFEEGVIPASNVLEAHTAWLSAQSEKIDAQIDVKLTEIYLRKATGELTIDN